MSAPTPSFQHFRIVSGRRSGEKRNYVYMTLSKFVVWQEWVYRWLGGSLLICVFYTIHHIPLHNEIQQYSISKAISSLQYAPKLNSPTPHNRKLTRQLHSNSIYFIQNGPVIHLPQSNTFVLHLIIFYSSLEKIIMIPNPRDQI